MDSKRKLERLNAIKSEILKEVPHSDKVHWMYLISTMLGLTSQEMHHLSNLIDRRADVMERDEKVESTIEQTLRKRQL